MNHLHPIVKRAIRRPSLAGQIAVINEIISHGADTGAVAQALESFTNSQPTTRRDGENALRAIELVLHGIAGPPANQPPQQQP